MRLVSLCWLLSVLAVAVGRLFSVPRAGWLCACMAVRCSEARVSVLVAQCAGCTQAAI